MGYRRRRASIILASCLVLGACTTVQATHRGAVAYNRAFADARNELLLLNILRASVNEPLQFSTISGVSGPMRAALTGTTGLDNFLLGPADVLKLGGGLGFRNPSVNIAPLDTKEFRQGMMRPVSLQLVDELLAQGADQAALLHLVVGAVECPGAGVRVNTGTTTLAPIFEDAARTTIKWDVVSKDGDFMHSFVVPANEAAKLLKEGAGDGAALSLANRRLQPTDDKFVRLELRKASSTRVVGSTFNKVCGANAPIGSEKLLLRSPEGMVSFLGALHRNFPHSKFFNIRRPGGRLAVREDAPIRTRFKDALYYIASRAEAGEEDKTLQTLSILTGILAMQTTDATLQSSKPILTIPQ